MMHDTPTFVTDSQLEKRCTMNTSLFNRSLLLRRVRLHAVLAVHVESCEVPVHMASQDSFV